VSLSGAAGNADEEVEMAELAALISRLAPGEALTVAELGPDEFSRWEIRADRCGTPAVRHRSVGWPALYRDDTLDEFALLGFLAPDDEKRLLVARNETGIQALDTGRALRVLRTHHASARLLAPGPAPSLDGLLREVTAGLSLPQWYELLTLEQDEWGQLTFAQEQLFEPGDRRGATRQLHVRCEPSGPAGTTFAVVARDSAHLTGLVSVASAKVPPAEYALTATLLRPGMVNFEGLPAPLYPDDRSWPEIRAAAPKQARRYGPAHLIVAIETCGSQDQLDAHLDRAEQLIRNVAVGAESQVRFSLIAYGAHPHDPRLDDVPVDVPVWVQREQDALNQLRLLREHALAQQRRYSRAASIECMLATVAQLLETRQRLPGEEHPLGRPVLVTIGGRPPFPRGRDRYTEILPCTVGLDWRTCFLWLIRDHQEMTFGAICGGDQDAEVWRLLGTDASADTVAFDAGQFAADLGLLRPASETVPLPLIIR
jgi:hypothetical protein